MVLFPGNPVNYKTLYEKFFDSLALKLKIIQVQLCEESCLYQKSLMRLENNQSGQ